MTAHGLRQLPATVSGCFVFVFAVFVFVFFFSKTLEMFMYVVPLSLALPWIIHLARSQSRVFCFVFLFWSNFFLSCLWGRNKGEHAKRREGRSGNCFPHHHAEGKIVIRIPRLNTLERLEKKKKKSPLPVWLVHAQHDFLFREEQLNFTCVSAFRSGFVACAKGDAHSIVHFTYVRWLATTQRGDNSRRCKQVAKVTNAITKWKFKVQL